MPYSPISPPVPAQLGRVLERQEPPGSSRRSVEGCGQLQALTGPFGGDAGGAGCLHIAGLGSGAEQRPGGADLVEIAPELVVEAEQGIGGPQDRGAVQRAGLDRLQGGHHPTGRPDGPGRRGGHRLGDPDIPADQGEGAELPQGPLVEPLLGPPAVPLSLPHEVETLLELPGPEPAGAGEQHPGGGQVLLDQLGLAHGLPGDDGHTGQDQAEQQQDEHTTHDGPLRTILDRR